MLGDINNSLILTRASRHAAPCLYAHHTSLGASLCMVVTFASDDMDSECELVVGLCRLGSFYGSNHLDERSQLALLVALHDALCKRPLCTLCGHVPLCMICDAD